ncbi:hypothetical protein BDN72DRAFT_837910 [Pluteus cervinus]|uniref:Uncharacterized protein n=1 Tax=Pluteus cervinus TaxID=181527 RepID=A0ACD3AZ84_9AGAR|nr:hypothetical protein BDN72DRAFT_837910 [Pluteus cervinus]
MALVVEASSPQNATGFTIAGLALDAAYNRIHTEILHWEHHIRSLKSLHNSITPVSRLPNELLSRIMNIAYPQSGTPPHTRLILSWVCRYWRNIALADPQLWCMIPDDPPLCLEYMQECIARSKSCDLEIHLWFPSNAVFKSCMAQLHRIRRLSSGTNLHHAFRRWRSRKCHSLRNCPDVCPDLTFLELVKCKFDWGSPLSASALTTLRIISPHTTMAGDFLAAGLLMMPFLVNCHLESCLKDITTPVLVPHRLSSLRSLYIEDKMNPILSFLRIIEISEICSSGRLHPSMWNDVRHLTIRPQAVEVENSSSTCKDSIVFHSDTELDFDTLPFSRHLLSINHLETLCVEGPFHNLPEIVGALDSLRIIKFYDRAETVSDLLAYVIYAEENGQMVVPLPALMELHCDSPSFLLYNVLENRRNVAQRRLPKLVFRECSRADMERYNGVADVVTSNGFLSVEDLETDGATLSGGSALKL